MKPTKIVALIFALTGVLFLAAGLIGSTITGNFIAKCEETTGVITRLDRAGESAYAAYTVGGERYESKLDAYTSSMRVGNEIKIFYDPQDPSSLATDAMMLVWLILDLVGAGCLLTAAVIYLVGRFSDERQSLLLSTGKRLPCTIDKVEEIKSVSMGSRHPYRLVLHYENAATGEKRRFVSPYLWRDPSGGMTRQTADVCVDEYNDKKYAVDITTCGLDESYLTAARKARNEQ